MSIYGSIIRENNDIMYMWNIFQYETSLTFDSFDNDIVMEINFEQIKGKVSEIAKVVMEKIKKFIGWIKEKFTKFINIIKDKFTEVKNKNKKPVKEMAEEIEKEVLHGDVVDKRGRVIATDSTDKKEEEKKPNISKEELKEFYNRKTKIAAAPEELLRYATNILDKTIKESDSKALEEFTTFEDYWRKKHNRPDDAKILSESDGTTVKELIYFHDFEKNIKEMDNFIVNSASKSMHDMEEGYQYAKQLFEQTKQNADPEDQEKIEEFEQRLHVIERKVIILKNVMSTLSEYYAYYVSEYNKISKFLRDHSMTMHDVKVNMVP